MIRYVVLWLLVYVFALVRAIVAYKNDNVGWLVLFLILAWVGLMGFVKNLQSMTRQEAGYGYRSDEELR